MNTRMLAILAAACLVALLSIEIWQVQQIKLMQHQLRESEHLRVDVQRMLYEHRLAMKRAERPVRQAASAKASAPSSDAQPKTDSGRVMPEAAGVLLQQALDGLQRAIAANEAGDALAAASEVPAIKEAVWKAGDIWQKYQTPLRELMGPLDYAVTRLQKGEKADFRKPLKVVQGLLRKGRKR